MTVFTSLFSSFYICFAKMADKWPNIINQIFSILLFHIEQIWVECLMIPSPSETFGNINDIEVFL